MNHDFASQAASYDQPQSHKGLCSHKYRTIHTTLRHENFRASAPLEESNASSSENYAVGDRTTAFMEVHATL